LVADEGGEDLGFELVEFEQLALAGDAFLLEGMEGVEARDDVALVTTEAFVEIEVVEGGFAAAACAGGRPSCR
jgi:hypothetical protein